jgi:hypothetical protein
MRAENRRARKRCDERDWKWANMELTDGGEERG